MVLLAASGCYHKDVMTDTADDVVATFLYQGSEGNFVITMEHVFQATSKESGGGVTHISGYTEVRLSAYDVETGELRSRVELGDMIDDACPLLGYSPGKVWMFSIDPEIGLHYRDPATLEIKESWAQLSQHPGLSEIKPAKPEWSNIDGYFNFDFQRQRVLLTDEAGYKYALDPNTLAVTKVEMDMPRVEWDEGLLSNGGQFIRDRYINLDGDPRRTIEVYNKKNSSDLSFLHGQWITDINPDNEGRRMKNYQDSLAALLQAAGDTMKALEVSHPEAIANYDWRTNDRKIMDLNLRYQDLKRQVEELTRNVEYSMRPYEKSMNEPLLTPDGKRAFVLHASIVADTAHSIVTCLELQGDSTFRKLWDAHLPGIYFDTGKADNAGAFETVYSKGNPEFDYEWAGCDGKHLLLIRQLHFLGLDLATGKLLWDREI